MAIMPSPATVMGSRAVSWAALGALRHQRCGHIAEPPGAAGQAGAGQILDFYVYQLAQGRDPAPPKPVSKVSRV